MCNLGLLKKIFQKYSSAFFSLVSTARSLQNPLFIALVSYVFIKNSKQDELTLINQVLILINLLSVFTGWGMKSYLLREQIANSGTFKNTWSHALTAKIMLNMFACTLCFVVCPADKIIIILALITIRTFNLNFEPLLLLSNKNIWAFSIEWLFYILIFLSVYFGYIDQSKQFLILLTLSEFCKSVFLLFIFKEYFIKTKIKPTLHLLWKTRFFFISSLAGFFQSKADLYVLGFLLKDISLNQYQIITSMLSLASISIATFTSLYSKLFYKNLNNSKQKFFHVNFYTGLFVAALFTLILSFLLPQVYDYRISSTQIVLIFMNIIIFSMLMIEMHHYTKLNKVNVSTLIIFLSGGVNLMLSFLLVQQFSVSGALISNTTGLAVLYLSLLLIRKKLITQASLKPYN